MLCTKYLNIFHKIFCMSKKKKVQTSKAAGKKPIKKPLKKAAKPSKKVVKSASKPANAKKVTKPVAKKPAKKVVAKKAVKKVSKPVKKVAPKKAIAKKVISPKKKVAPKKAPVKKALAKPIKKVEVKKVTPAKKESSKKDLKPVKLVEKAPVKTKPEITKKEVVVLAKKESNSSVEKTKKTTELPTKKQLSEKKANEVLAITNTIPVAEANEISASKIASISHSITNPIKKTASYSIKPEKEPNGKFEMEFVVHASAEMLFEFLSTPSGLSEWFCDDLNIRNGIYTFIWEDQLQQARLLKTVDLQVVRFQWVDKTDGSYFEFRIQRDDLTNDISLIITDFAETVSERESSKLLWHSQIEKLMHVLGSIF